MIGSLTPLLSLGSGSGSPSHWCGVQSSASVEAGPQGIDQRSSPVKWQLPKLAFTVTSEAATNSKTSLFIYSSLLTNMHSPLDSITHILGICTHPYTGAPVSSTYARTHVPMPRRLLSKPTAAFYVYLFLSFLLFAMVYGVFFPIMVTHACGR